MSSSSAFRSTRSCPSGSIESSLDRHAVGNGPFELGQVVPQEHNAVRVVDSSVLGHEILRRAAVLGDVNLLGLPEGLHALKTTASVGSTARSLKCHL